MENKKNEAKNKTLFIICSVLTIGLVLTGWFFSFRDTWRGRNFSFTGFQKVGELKDGVKDISTEFKNNIESTTDGVGTGLQEATDALRESYEQQEQIKEVIGENMKNNLANQYEETQENNQAPVE